MEPDGRGWLLHRLDVRGIHNLVHTTKNCAGARAMSRRKTVNVVGPTGVTASVGWFEGTSGESIESSITSALGLPAEPLVARDPEGNILALSDSLPQGISLNVQPLSESLRGREGREQRSLKFRGQVLKLFAQLWHRPEKRCEERRRR